MKFIRASNILDVLRIHKLAEHIWSRHYEPLIGAEMVHYMLTTVHGPAAIQAQIDSGMIYEIVITDEGNDCAYCAYQIQDDHCFISKLYVSENYRGQALGKVRCYV